MSDRTITNQGGPRKALRVLAGCLGLLALTAGAARPAAKEPAAREEPRTVLGRCASGAGSLLQRRGPKEDWQVVKADADVSSRDLLLALPGSRGEIDTKTGVRLTLAGNWPVSPLFPVLESAVVLHPGKEFDLDFTLDRGRVLVVNRKKKGAARVRARFQGQSWELTLEKQGTEVALERIGRWLTTPPASKVKTRDRPETKVFLIVLKGEADIEVDMNQFSLKAPPGPALFTWSNRVGNAGPESLDELPSWARTKAASKTARAAVERLQKALAKGSKGAVNTALKEALRSKTVGDRELAVYCLGAVDDLTGLLDALESSKPSRVRVAAIYELRHWLGRQEDAGNLLHALVKRKYSKGQADIFMQLLHGFSEGQFTRPETYAVLIEYLKHDRVAIRELAHWHLIIQVPDGVDIPYDAAGDRAQRERAYARWKQRIPDGQMPGKRKPKKKE
jgi:hypothetical protein